MIKGFDKINYRDYFDFALESRARGHSLKLLKKRSNGEFRKHLFTQRVVNCWNSLSQSVVDADSINSFMNRLV